MIPSRSCRGRDAGRRHFQPVRRLLLGCAALLTLGTFVPSTGEAALSRGIQVAGTTSGPGVWSITIESFPPGPFDPRRYPAGLEPRDAKSLASTTVNVPVSSGATAYSTNIAITAAINAALAPATLGRSVIFRDPGVALVITDSGTFNMSIAGGAPGQNVTETSPVCCPASTPWGLLLLGGSVILLGFIRFGRAERLG
jgi:hypothetical protein